MRGLLFWQPPAMLKECIVNLVGEDGLAYRGVLFGYRCGWLTFKHVYALRAGAEPAKVDGDIVIHRDRIDFLQVLQ